MKTLKPIARILLPENVRRFIGIYIPRISKNNTYILKKEYPIVELNNINEKFYIRKLELKDKEAIWVAYGKKENFDIQILPRLKNDAWVGLAVFNQDNNEIAYISWIIIKNTPFIKEFGINLKSNQFFLRHGFCVPKYRHQGLHTRMEQERINYCVKHGANEIFIQIGSKNKKGIESVTNNSYSFYQQNYIILITGLGIYRELLSFLKNPFKRII